MKNSFTSFRRVIEAVRGNLLGAATASNSEFVDFNVYWENRAEGPKLDDEVFVGKPESVNPDLPYEEYDYASLPQIVKDRGWWLAYDGELLEDVVANALRQKPAVTSEELLTALRHYTEFDCFLKLS